MNAISIIICSHRAPTSLDLTLRSIIAQTSKEQLEVILVNNGFAADRERGIREAYKSQIDSGLFRIVRETRPGLVYARCLGVKMAQHDLVVFLDDDNTVHERFIEAIRAGCRKYGTIGGICPRIEPKWQKLPPKWIQEFGLFCLSYNSLPDSRPPYDEAFWNTDSFNSARVPPGGGMIISRKAASSFCDQIPSGDLEIIGRGPKNLASGEDFILYRNIQQLKLPVIYLGDVIVYHHIPESRTRMQYLTKLNFQLAYAYEVLAGERRFRSRLRNTKALIAHAALGIYRSRGNLGLWMLHMTRAWGALLGSFSNASSLRNQTPT